jgi:hypothetical protein
MASITEIRQQFPQYNDMSDTQLADAMYKTHYADMPRAQFDAKIGMAAPEADKPERTFGQRFSDVSAGVEQAPYDILQSAAELGARGLDATGITTDALPKLKQAFEQGNQTGAELAGADRNSGFYKGGRIAGQVAATLPLSELNVLRGAGLAAKLPTLARIGDAAGQGAAAAALTSNSSDAPLGDQMALGAIGGAALPMAGAALKLGGKAIPLILGETTGAGANSIKQAFKAGQAGGDTSKAFTGSMRGDVPWGQVVADAKTAVANLKAQRGQAYRAGMADVSKDATVLDFGPVDKALEKANSINSYKGEDLSPETTDVREDINAAVARWKGLDPAEYHTPEGFDALKQRIGNIKDNQPFGSAQRTIADEAYNAIRKTIADQAPAYDKVMQDYSEASEALDAVQKELSLGKKGNPNTALRKLQSVMRDNANTSWGDRAKYADKLAAAGAPNLLPSLAGKALSTPIPRGLTKYADMAAAAAGGMTNPGTLAALPLASPRIVGEVAHGAGAASRHVANAFHRVTIPNVSLLNPVMGTMAPALLMPQR